MSDTKRLDEIEARAGAASAGPWEPRFIYRMFGAARRDPKLMLGTDAVHDCPDSEFIAHARADVPWLAGLVREALWSMEGDSTMGCFCEVVIDKPCKGCRARAWLARLRSGR